MDRDLEPTVLQTLVEIGHCKEQIKELERRHESDLAEIKKYQDILHRVVVLNEEMIPISQQDYDYLKAQTTVLSAIEDGLRSMLVQAALDNKQLEQQVKETCVKNCSDNCRCKGE